MGAWKIGIMGGSGLYELDGLQDRRWNRVETPWGPPSDELLSGTLHGVELVFLPRHGRGHRIPPGDLNTRANIAALKAAGCTDVLSISAVGSLKEEHAPGIVRRRRSVYRPDGRAAVLLLRTRHRRPCVDGRSGLSAAVGAGLEARAGQRRTDRGGGTYLAIEGPQFSTRAESHLYRSWGCDVIGMTGMPEARLAREAELPYACVGMVTDYDCWREHTADVAGHRRSGDPEVQCRGGARPGRDPGAGAAGTARAVADRHDAGHGRDHRARSVGAGAAGPGWRRSVRGSSARCVGRGSVSAPGRRRRLPAHAAGRTASPSRLARVSARASRRRPPHPVERQGARPALAAARSASSRRPGPGRTPRGWSPGRERRRRRRSGSRSGCRCPGSPPAPAAGPGSPASDAAPRSPGPCGMAVPMRTQSSGRSGATASHSRQRGSRPSVRVSRSRA